MPVSAADRGDPPSASSRRPKTVCASAAFAQDVRLAVIRRADNGRWALPGGYADVGATPSENARRELREETGLEAELERLIGVYDNRRYGSVAAYQFYTLLFRARITGGAARPSHETTDVRLVTPREAPDEMNEMHRAMIRDALAASGAPVFE